MRDVSEKIRAPVGGVPVVCEVPKEVEMKYLILDYETRSEANLKRVGAFEYACHPSTEILCVAWRFGTREELRTAPVKTWSPFNPSPYGELIRALCDPSVKLIAHNAFFEQVITRHVLSKIVNRPELCAIPPTRWTCTAARARALALPGNLEGASHALALAHQKDMGGHRLMLKMCKPRKPTKTNPAKWHDSPEDLARLTEYCAHDILAETELFFTLPALSPSERRVWELDQAINLRGFHVDRTLTKTILEMIDEETRALNLETEHMTLGILESTTQRDGVLDWLGSEGIMLPDLRAKTVRDAISAGMAPGEAGRLLTIRQAVSRTSTAKFSAFEMRSRHDSRIRDHLVYHTASTGRWGGAGIQPQNFPRGTIKDTEQAAEVLALGDLELVRLLYGDPMEVFSSCLRAMITPTPGKRFFCADYSSIEVRVLFWIADHFDGINAFRDDRPIYEEMAAEIYSKKVSAVDRDERQLGKKAILGCGFQMGKSKFLQTCLDDGLKINEELAGLAVDAYRSAHRPVVKLWSNLNRAAIFAVQNPGKKVRINHTAWWVEGKFLYCELPSGRRLAYYGPEVRQKNTPWGEKQPALYHWGVNSVTRKWELAGTYGGMLTENVVQATARDLMADAMVRIDDGGKFKIVLSVHDELLTEGDADQSIGEFESLMAITPAWADGLPVKVAGWTGSRYRK